jgi:ABC-type sugar transport system substrate-binding protein
MSGGICTERRNGAMRALQTAGKTDVMVVGFDGTP